MGEIRSLNTADTTHCTLSRVVRRGVDYFAFAVTDAGGDVFIPPAVCKRYNLTDADVGAGFRALVRRDPAATEGARTPLRVCAPVTFDDTAPRRVDMSPAAIHAQSVRNLTGDEPSPDDLPAEVAQLLERVDDLLETLPALQAALTKLQELKGLVDDLFPHDD